MKKSSPFNVLCTVVLIANAYQSILVCNGASFIPVRKQDALPLYQCNHHYNLFSFSRPSVASEADAAIVHDEQQGGVDKLYTVEGLKCREITIDLWSSSTLYNRGDSRMQITILEATAESQEQLVMMALDEEVGNHEDKVGVDLSHEDPYGSVLWPAASAVASYMLDEIPDIREKSILEVGTGTGLVSLAAYKAGAKEVLATDYEEIPLVLLRKAANLLSSAGHYCNKPKDGCETILKTSLFDICDFDANLPQADVLVAADIMYEPKTGKAMARRVYEALDRGYRVLVGDSPGRAGRPAFLSELRSLLKDDTIEFVDSLGTTCSGPRHDLICGRGSSSVSKEGEEPKMLKVGILDLNLR